MITYYSDIMNLGLQFQELVVSRAKELFYLNGPTTKDIFLVGWRFDECDNGQKLLNVTFEEDDDCPNTYNVDLTAEQVDMSDDEWTNYIKIKETEKLKEKMERAENIRQKQLERDIAEYTRLKEKLGY